MESMQKKSGARENRKAGDGAKAKQESSGGGEKKRGGFFRRNQKSASREAADYDVQETQEQREAKGQHEANSQLEGRSQRDGKNQRESKSQRETQVPKNEAPLSFNAHALDMEPGFVAPERPSVDLTYIDFTRESVAEGERRHFVPKKRNIVPYELSETPRTQQDSRDGRSQDRRRQQSFSPVETNPPPETISEQKRPQSGESRETAMDTTTKGTDRSVKGEDRRERQQRPKQEKSKPQENVGARRSENQGDNSRTKPEKAAKRKDQTSMRSNRDHKENRDTANRSTANRDAVNQEATSQEAGKESLIRPYWMKK